MYNAYAGFFVLFRFFMAGATATAAAFRAADTFAAFFLGFDHITGGKPHDQDDHADGDPC